MPCLNGVKVPSYFKTPIPTSELEPGCLIGWSKAKGDIIRSMRGEIYDSEGALVESGEPVLDSESDLHPMSRTLGETGRENIIRNNEDVVLD